MFLIKGSDVLWDVFRVHSVGTDLNSFEFSTLKAGWNWKLTSHFVDPLAHVMSPIKLRYLTTIYLLVKTVGSEAFLISETVGSKRPRTLLAASHCTDGGFQITPF
uniref:Uncharacterized protein n=1 Tax=Nelumbo nucifera TaxID=4432 RepID=A0A822ZV53_NELNU|nr:TPA_asm: hypothetical protein HUJ06_017338 [Nelumbo nucifera]